ncbi:MAG: hypothetical protein LBP21_03225 [Synergistaceae bacterium]|jgi:hypothetical protein|nr:hypothetical protein [Synergistaceae bacterium]
MSDGTLRNFSQPVCNALGHYVYCLADPRNNEIFYVGKGQNNRVFDHQCQPGQENEDEADGRIARINAIEAAGQEVGRYILCHDLEEETAFIVESCIISLLQAGLLKNAALLNRARGHRHSKWGIVSVDKIAAKYSLPMQDDCFTDPVMVVNISRSLRTTAATVYEAAKGDWTASEKRLTRRLGEHYVIAEYDGVLVDVFKPASWEKLPNGRMRFENTPGFETGEEKHDELFRRYCNRLAAFHQPGDANPIHYFNM